MSDRPTMVIADDHVHVRAGVRAMIEDMDLADIVAVVDNGTEALARLLELQPDIALVDQRMSGMTGIEVAVAAQEAGSTTAVVILSSYANAALVRRAINSGAAGYIAKDSSEDAFRFVVTTVLSGKPAVDPQLMPLLIRGEKDDDLSPRQLEILQRIAIGQMNEQIASDLGLATETVKTHVSTILRKFNASSRTEAVAVAMRQALID